MCRKFSNHFTHIHLILTTQWGKYSFANEETKALKDSVTWPESPRQQRWSQDDEPRSSRWLHVYTGGPLFMTREQQITAQCRLTLTPQALCHVMFNNSKTMLSDVYWYLFLQLTLESLESVIHSTKNEIPVYVRSIGRKRFNFEQPG